MNQLASVVRKYSYAAVSLLLFGAIIAPSLLAGNAAAGQVLSRSVTPSTSITGESATYRAVFTPESTSATIGGVVIDFCDSPIPGTTCASSGVVFGTLGVTATGVTGTWTAAGSGSRITLSNSTPAAPSGEVSFEITGLTNPTLGAGVNAATVYARIFTYPTSADAGSYTSTNPGTTVIDSGAAAFAVTRAIDITAIVRETLTFCVSGQAPAAGCTGTLTAPVVNLGVQEPGTDKYVIDSTAVYTADVFYQLNTNATHGTTISIGGDSLHLASGSSTINSTASPAALVAGTAGFGVSVVDPGATPTEGAALVRDSGIAGSGSYSMPTTTTSPYGAPVAANGGPVVGANGTLRFGATASPSTPAGVYKATYNLIAAPRY